MKKRILNDKGFGALGILVGVLVLSAIGGIGFYVLKNKDQDKKKLVTTSSPSPSVTPTETPKNDITKGWTTVRSEDTSHPFEVKVPKALLPYASCKTKEILFAVTFNSSLSTYDCDDFKSSLNYASIVFGTRPGSLVTSLGNLQTSSKVTLADGKTTATKSIVTAQIKTGADSYTARYVVYEAKSQGSSTTYYALYKTGVGFSDENYFLKDFEAVATHGWTIQ